MKTYGTILNTLSSTFATDNGGRVRVKMSKVGGLDGNFSTNDVIVQGLIEATEFFKRGSIFIVPQPLEVEGKSKDGKDDDEDEDELTPIEVSSIQASSQYLKDTFNSRDSSIDTPEKITEYARKKGILFVIK